MASVINFHLQVFVLFCLLNCLSTVCTVSRGRCFPGWYKIGQSCFKVESFDEDATKYKDQGYDILNSARKKCFETGSDLAIPRNRSLLDKLRNITVARRGSHLLGAHDSFRLDLKWSTSGDHLNPALWRPGEPNITLGKCVVANFSSDLYGWWLKTTKCDLLRGFICETLTAEISCAAGVSHNNGHCYKIYHTARSNWANASKICSSDGYRLATVNTTLKRQGLSDLLENFTSDFEEKELYLDRVSTDLDSWKWMDGSPINPNLWKSGYPEENQKKTCVHLDKNESAIINLPCEVSYVVAVICQNRDGKSILVILKRL
ncbi:uncharacterized protein LOC111341067 [Stylophora pistillata]|uniref:uncharacterized protein LOC111341067 n=1 Tax=Stylophora pistillata TaxID=50429 RepID=UPI000C0458DE|nr:uncharacterized protein LOC111341067 [Stylophora pistillata]